MADSIDIFAAWEKAQSPLIDTAEKMERAQAAAIHASGRAPHVEPVRKSPPERLKVIPAPARSDEYDPLYKLMRQERALIVAGTRGEAVGEDLKEVRNAIRSIVEQRNAKPEVRLQPYERER